MFVFTLKAPKIRVFRPKSSDSSVMIHANYYGRDILTNITAKKSPEIMVSSVVSPISDVKKVPREI